MLKFNPPEVLMGQANVLMGQSANSTVTSLQGCVFSYDLQIQDKSDSLGISIIVQDQRPGKKPIKMLHPRGKSHRFWGCDWHCRF